MDNKYAVCVLETIGNGLKLSDENDKESACIVAIKAIDTIEKIKNIIREPEHYEVSNSFENPRPNKADYDAVSADKFKRIWNVISEARIESDDYCEWFKLTIALLHLKITMQIILIGEYPKIWIS